MFMFSSLTTGESLQASVSVLGRRKPTAQSESEPGPISMTGCQGRERCDEGKRDGAPARNANHISSSGRWVPEAAIRAAAASAATVRGVLRLWRNGSVVRYQSSRQLSSSSMCARSTGPAVQEAVCHPGSCCRRACSRMEGCMGIGFRRCGKRRRLPRRRHAGAGVPWVPCGADSKAGFAYRYASID